MFYFVQRAFERVWPEEKTLSSQLEKKVTRAVNFIRDTALWYKNPVVYSSFGKDSMVLLSLVQQAGFKFPILFHREPHHPLKYVFANRVIELASYEVHDYPPMFTRLSVGKKGDVEIINYHQCGEKVIYMPTGIRAPEEGHPFLCGLIDIYNKPCGSFSYPWDVGLIGHKNTDKDPILGDVGLKTELYHNEKSADFVFPLRDFTDADVWEYTQVHKLPVNYARYDKKNNWKEKKDITFNPDYFHACTSCLTSDTEVWCPKFQKTVPSAGALRVDAPMPSYIDTDWRPNQ